MGYIRHPLDLARLYEGREERCHTDQSGPVIRGSKTLGACYSIFLEIFRSASVMCQPGLFCVLNLVANICSHQATEVSQRRIAAREIGAGTDLVASALKPPAGSVLWLADACAFGKAEGPDPIVQYTR